MEVSNVAERRGLDILQSKGIYYSRYKERAFELYPRLKNMHEDFFIANYKCYALYVADEHFQELDDFINEMHGD